MQPSHSDSPESIRTRTIAVVGFYFFVSILLVFLNKYILAPEFEFPIFLTWIQLVIALGCIWGLGELGKSTEAFAMIPKLEFDVEEAKKIAPLSLIFVCMISFNNLCLFYVEVTFYQVVRSLTIVFTIAFTKVILGQSTSTEVIRACGIVITGFVIGSIGEVNFTWLGIIFGMCSSAFVSLYGIYVKRIMAIIEGDEWKLMNYNTMLSILFMFPLLVATGELNQLMKSSLLYSLSNWLGIIVSGMFGFLINLAVFLQIKYTSPLTNNISGTLKACIQTLLAMLIFRNPISLLNAVGIALVIGGSSLYSHVRYKEIEKMLSQKNANR